MPLMIMGVFCVWCAYNLFFGAGNVFTLQRMQLEEAELSQHLSQVRSQREALEAKVVRVRPDSIDWDMIDEQAIKMLGELPASGKALNM